MQVNGDATSEPNETFFVNLSGVTGATVGDAQGQGTIQNDDVTLIPIHDIQGNGTASPLVGQTVTTTGIVTLLRTGTNNGGAANGFFIQDPVVDADPNTSEGIFVFTGIGPDRRRRRLGARHGHGRRVLQHDGDQPDDERHGAQHRQLAAGRRHARLDHPRPDGVARAAAA